MIHKIRQQKRRESRWVLGVDSERRGRCKAEENESVGARDGLERGEAQAAPPPGKPPPGGCSPGTMRGAECQSSGISLTGRLGGGSYVCAESAKVSWILDKQKTNASLLPQALQAPLRLSPDLGLGCGSLSLTSRGKTDFLCDFYSLRPRHTHTYTNSHSDTFTHTHTHTHRHTY